MTGIYLLIVLFTQLSPSNLFAGLDTGPNQITVAFEELKGIQIGSPVTVRGQLVGSVARISRTSDKEGYQVDVKISSRHRTLLLDGTVALIASPMTAARSEPVTVIELLSPLADEGKRRLGNGEQILGFVSYEEFWAAGVDRRKA